MCVLFVACACAYGCFFGSSTQSDYIRVVDALTVPLEGELTAQSGCALPNAQYCSDHLSLCFDMILGMPHSGSGAVAAGGGGMPPTGYPVGSSSAPIASFPQGISRSLSQQQVAQQQSREQQSRLGAGAVAYIPRNTSGVFGDGFNTGEWY